MTSVARNFQRPRVTLEFCQLIAEGCITPNLCVKARIQRWVWPREWEPQFYSTAAYVNTIECTHRVSIVWRLEMSNCAILYLGIPLCHVRYELTQWWIMEATDGIGFDVKFFLGSFNLKRIEMLVHMLSFWMTSTEI